MTLEHYEEGILVANVLVRNKWWKFWLPKSIEYAYGKYTKMGNMLNLSLVNGMNIIGRAVDE